MKEENKYPTQQSIVDWSDQDDLRMFVHPASPEAAKIILQADEYSLDGRSEWLFFRMPDGGLIFGVYPRGDTYFAIEEAADFPGEVPDPVWCETCGERPQIVHTDEAGLCRICAQEAINRLSAEVAELTSKKG